MITDDALDELVDYLYRLLGNYVAIAGFVLAGPGFWLAAALDWTAPQVLFPLAGVIAVAYAGYQLRVQPERVLKSPASSPQQLQDPVAQTTSSIDVLFTSDDGAVSSIDMDCHYPHEVDIDWMLREDRKALTTIVNNWTYAWTSLQLTTAERQEYVRARHAYNSNLYRYLDRLSGDLQEEQRQRSLASQLKVIQLVAENRGHHSIEHLQIELRPGNGLAFATVDQIAAASQLTTRVRASECLGLRKVPGFNDFLSDALLPSSDIGASSVPPEFSLGPNIQNGKMVVEIDRLIPGSIVELPRFTLWFGSDRKTKQVTLDVLIRSHALQQPVIRRLTINVRREGHAIRERERLNAAHF